MLESKSTVIDLKNRVAESARSINWSRRELERCSIILSLLTLRPIRGLSMIRALVVRNGYQPERGSDRRWSAMGAVTWCAARHRRHLKGISTGNFSDILGKGASFLSAATVMRLKEQWMDEYKDWNQRSLASKLYMWADGIYFNVRLSNDRPCMLVIMGATAEGKKELVGLIDGERESTLSWKELLLDLKRRGLEHGPEVAVGDGALGFWKALEEVYPGVRHQRCWVHKTANILDKLPKKLQPQAKSLIHQMYQAATKQDALAIYEQFLSLYRDKYPKACQCLEKDKDVLFTFYDFPAAHWMHLRSTNPIESTFATVRHRTRQTKGCGSREATLMMVYKLGREAEKRWRRLNGSQLLIKVLTGVRFVDGEELEQERLAA